MVAVVQEKIARSEITVNYPLPAADVAVTWLCRRRYVFVPVDPSIIVLVDTCGRGIRGGGGDAWLVEHYFEVRSTPHGGL